MTDLRIAIISFEHMHAVSYAASFARVKGATLVAIADDDPDRLAQARELASGLQGYYDNYKAMLDEVAIDAVIICSNNKEHHPIAIECASRGKHILCEKPLAPTVELSQEIIEAARQSGITLMTAFPVRFSASIHETRNLLQSEALGKIIGGACSNHGKMPGGWFVNKELSGGGAVIDHTVHVVDVLRWMMDDEVESVYAEKATKIHQDLQVEDIGQLVLKFRKGAVISLDTSWSRPKSYSIWGDVKIALKGTKGNSTLNCFPQQINHFDDVAMGHSGYNMGDDLDQLMVQEFIDAVLEKRTPLVTGEDGLKAVEVALAAYKSAESGTTVTLP